MWNGFVAFETVGKLAEDLRQRILDRRNGTPETEVIEIINQKKSYGRFNHGDKKIQSEFINDLFEDPQLLLNKLSGDKKYIIPGDPGEQWVLRETDLRRPNVQSFLG